MCSIPYKSLNFSSAVNEIRSAFGLTKTELAEVCQAQSRKILYDWINGETAPRKSTISRIYDLLITARSWISSGFTADQELLHQPVIDNQSVFDLLKKSDIDKELINFAGSRLHMSVPAHKDLTDPFA